MNHHAFTTVLLSSIALAACSSATPESSDPKSEAASTEAAKPPAGAASSSSASCATHGTDPEALSVCHGSKGTAGRCVPVSFLGSNKDTFEVGDCGPSTACVPDDLVRTGGNVQLKTCTVFGKEGRCFWPLAKDIAANYDVLKSQTGAQCDADQVCAPCVNPLDGTATGVCDLGKSSCAN